MKPIVMKPTYRHYLWGGEKLRAWGKDAPEHPLAESWEVSCRPDGMTVDAQTGRSLAEIWGQAGRGEFPLLIKLIDAAKDLSVQVHPDDAAAQAMGQPFGKNECWYVLQAEPGARLALGLREDMDAEALKKAALEGYLADCLHWIEPKVGDCFYIPAGTIHALGAGLMVAEVQQNSDTTYRLYDYGRLDADGTPRPLHLEQALAVADLKKSRPCVTHAEGDGWYCLCENRDFRLERGNTPRQEEELQDFVIVIALDTTDIFSAGGHQTLSRGQTCWIDATVRDLRIEPRGEVLWITGGKRNA